MPQCADCGTVYVWTLWGALDFAMHPEEFRKVSTVFAATVFAADALAAGIEELRAYSLRRWGRGLDLQTTEDIAGDLCVLRPDCRQAIPGLGTFNDPDAAFFLPLAEALETLRTVQLRPGAGDTAGASDQRTLEECKARRTPPSPPAAVAADAQSRTPGRPGRRGYPLEALAYARKLRAENPQMKAAAIRKQCLALFPEDDLPPDPESFRRWLNRKRANRAN
jgi:hypothetical protein